MSENITTETQDRVRIIRIARPERKNALTQEMYSGLSEALDAASADDAVRAVLLAGSEGCFSSGNDIASFLSAPPLDGESNPVRRFMLSLAGCPKPVVAAVVGPAIGVGATLLLHCDLVYAGAGARLHFPFVNLGICPEFASSYILPRLAGHQRAAELILLGEPFDAGKALELGLVNEILPDAGVEARALERAHTLAAKPPQALRTAKSLLKRWDADRVPAIIDEEGAELGVLLKGPEAAEAITAFSEKRAPDFSQF